MRRNTTILVSIALAAFAPTSSGAQTVKGQSLKGNWVRVDSNNNPADQMRIHIDGDGTLTVVPTWATRWWQVGQVLWNGITPSGGVQVRGSNGGYFTAQITVVSPNEITLDISRAARGDIQTWRRAGPDLGGDWVRVATPGTPADGIRLRGSVADAAVRFLPGAAPRFLRVGSKLWQNPSASGTVEVLGSDRQYHTGTLAFVTPDHIVIDAPQVAGGPGQVWVRPTLVASTRAGLAGPPPNPNAPGSELQPPATTPVYTPPTAPPPPGPRACFDTSAPDDRMRMDWGLSISTTNVNPITHESAGIGEFEGPRPSSDARTYPPDLEHFDVPGIGTVELWLTRPNSVARWSSTTNLWARPFDQEVQRARNNGMRPKDFEVGVDPLNSSSGPVFSAVWESNRAGLEWHLEYDLTPEEYGAAFQNYRTSGFRLVDMEVYGTASNPRYAAVWWASCDDTNWKQVRGMNAGTFANRVTAEAQNGLQVIDVETYLTSAGQRYAAIWQRMPAGRDWQVRTADNFAEFLSLQRDFVDQGLRPVDLESLDTPNGIRYVGVWAENENRFDFALRPLVDNAVMNYRNLHRLPGISVVVMADDEVIYRRGLGWADSVSGKRAHAGTIYLTASISKAMAGNIAARLEARGDVDLTQPTSDFLSSLPSSHTHTLEQLLAKTGCVRHYDQETSAGEPDTLTGFIWQKDAVKDLWGDDPLTNCTPGSNYHYSTHGYTYLGAALEEVTGQSSIDLVETELAQPFGLTTLVPAGRLEHDGWNGFSGVLPYDMAQGYRRPFVGSPSAPSGPREAVDYENSTWKLFGGGLRINALDLARFGWLTSAGNTDRLWTSLTGGATSWNPLNGMRRTALGWVVDRRPPAMTVGSTMVGRLAAEHGGVARGARTFLRVYRDVPTAIPGRGPTTSLTIAVMTNQWRTPTSPLASWTVPLDDLVTTIAALVFQNPPP